jgi:hypothetical protein
MNTSYSIKTKIKYKWKAIGYQYKKKTHLIWETTLKCHNSLVVEYLSLDRSTNQS